MGLTRDTLYHTSSSYGNGPDTLSLPVSSGSKRDPPGLYHPEDGTPYSQGDRSRRQSASSYFPDSSHASVKTPGAGTREETASFHNPIGRSAGRVTAGNGISARAKTIDGPNSFRVAGESDDLMRGTASANPSSVLARRKSSGVETAELAGSTPAHSVTRTASRRRSHCQRDQSDTSFGAAGRNTDEYAGESSYSLNPGDKKAESVQGRSDRQSFRTRSRGGGDFSPARCLSGGDTTRRHAHTQIGSSSSPLHSRETPRQSPQPHGRSSSRRKTSRTEARTEDPHSRSSVHRFTPEGLPDSADRRYAESPELAEAAFARESATAGTRRGNQSRETGQVYAHGSSRSGVATEISYNDKAGGRSKSRAGASITKKHSWPNSAEHRERHRSSLEGTEKGSSRYIGSPGRDGGDESVRNGKGRQASTSADRAEGVLSKTTSDDRSCRKSSSSRQARKSRDDGFFVGDSLPVLRDALLLPEGRVYHLGKLGGENASRLLSCGLDHGTQLTRSSLYFLCSDILREISIPVVFCSFL